MGIVISQDTDPYETIRISWNVIHGYVSRCPIRFCTAPTVTLGRQKGIEWAEAHRKRGMGRPTGNISWYWHKGLQYRNLRVSVQEKHVFFWFDNQHPNELKCPNVWSCRLDQSKVPESSWQSGSAQWQMATWDLEGKDPKDYHHHMGFDYAHWIIRAYQNILV